MATAKKTADKSETKQPKKTAAKKAGGGLMTPLNPSPELAAVVGKDPLPRTEIIKKIWDYIKANDLQDEKNKRNINADDKLRPLFGKEQISMFELAKIVSQHVK